MNRYLAARATVLATMALIVPAGAAEPAPNIAGETVDQVAKRTGYTSEEVRTLFLPIEQWGRFGISPAPGKMADTFARDRFKAPPKPYVHPRIYFGPDQLPELRRRLARTTVGKTRMGLIRGRLLQLHSDRTIWEKDLPYLNIRKHPEIRDKWLARGRIIGRGASGFHGPWLGGMVDELAGGTVPAKLEKVWNDGIGKPRYYLMHLLPFEAFRCLIDEDAEGGKRVAAALTTVAKRWAKELPRLDKQPDWQRFYQDIQSQSMGLTYDWAYGFMSDQQRKAVRGVIAALTSGKHYISLDHVPGFPGNTSNWNIIHANLLPMVLSIEGEDGYDPLVYKRIVEGLRKWVYVASGPRGAPFEGFRKGRYAPKWLLPLASRGEALLGTQYCKNHQRQFSLHIMMPWGEQFVYETDIGTISPGADTFKYAHPGDPVLDVLYGHTVRSCFVPTTEMQWQLNVRTSYPPLYETLIVADDPAGAEGGKYDWDKAFDGLLAHLRKTREPLSYYSDYRGLMTARSAWDREATMLYFEPRNVPGGHTRASRNDFLVAALGRQWSNRPFAVEATSEFQSVVLIDGKGQGKPGGRCPAGRTVALADNAAATFAAADAAWAYGHVLVSIDHKHATPVPHSPNDSRLVRSRLPWMDRPWSVLPNWATGRKPAPRISGQRPSNPMGHGYWAPYNPVKYAYRTCGLVRGKHPYVLVVDDIRKDDAEHEYAWQMQIVDDLTVAKALTDGALDLTLADETNRRCLVRVLQAGEAPPGADLLKAAGLNTYTYDYRGRTKKHNRLLVPVRARTGRFKTLIFPYRKGAALPKTTWNAGRTTLTVTLKGQTDVFTFTPAPDGRTRIALTRNNAPVLTVK